MGSCCPVGARSWNAKTKKNIENKSHKQIHSHNFASLTKYAYLT
jgi:hypothetical protein